MYCLYIDTHFTNLVIALLLDGKVIDKEVLESNKHSENTINLIKEVLDNNKVSIDNVKEIIVINGPGSFTGVRIGVVVAKIMGYCKNIPIKAISFLQAVSLNYDEDVTLGIKDRNGVFVGSFNQKHELQEDYVYLSNKEIEGYPKEIIMEDFRVDIKKVYEFLKDKEEVSPHLLKPLYVKKIEVQNA